jgi:hypothetical protein
MIEPPDYLDGATVVQWAWAGQYPFGYVNHNENNLREEVFGLAICEYEDSKSIYRFCCDKNWEVIQDSPYNSIEEAVIQLPNQYKNVKIVWQTK